MLIRAFIFIIAFVLMGIYWVIPNEALMARITCESARGSEFSSFETMGSGRGGLAIDSLQIFSEANLGEKIFGVGETEQLERMMAIRGKKVVPHN